MVEKQLWLNSDADYLGGIETPQTRNKVAPAHHPHQSLVLVSVRSIGLQTRVTRHPSLPGRDSPGFQPCGSSLRVTFRIVALSSVKGSLQTITSSERSTQYEILGVKKKKT